MLRKISILAIFIVAAVAIGDELAVGDHAPAFTLTNAETGKVVSFVPADGRLKVVVFTCNQCPYAKAFEPRLVALGGGYAKRGVVFYAVNPNDEAQNSIESLDNMRERAADHSYPYPYLKDGDSKVAAAYGARVTPHVFVVDGTGVVRYRGYVDDSAKPENRSHTGLSDALDSLLAKQDVKVTATKAFGCTIKWKNKA
jgi:peroxiredoxin